jgi:hypothetical protein
MHQFLPRLIVGFHGTSKSVAEKLLGNEPFWVSDNTGDWLGKGVYFWLNDPVRALSWAQNKISKFERPSSDEAAVLGAVIDPGNCLDLTTKEGLSWLLLGHDQLAENMRTAGKQMLRNGTDANRPLDKAVVEQVHRLVEVFMSDNKAARRQARLQKIDSIMNVYPDGEPLYEGTTILAKTHVQLCLRDPARIIGVFKVKPELFKSKRMDGLV